MMFEPRLVGDKESLRAGGAIERLGTMLVEGEATMMSKTTV